MTGIGGDTRVSRKGGRDERCPKPCTVAASANTLEATVPGGHGQKHLVVDGIIGARVRQGDVDLADIDSEARVVGDGCGGKTSDGRTENNWNGNMRS